MSYCACRSIFEVPGSRQKAYYKKYFNKTAYYLLMKYDPLPTQTKLNRH
jgi:hypothetical protein